MQEAFQPGDRFRVQVVGRFIKQQHVRLFQQQAAQRHTTALTTRQVADFGIPLRQTHRVSGAVELGFQIVAIVRLNHLLQTALFGGQLVEVRIGIGVQRVDFIKTFQSASDFRHRFFNRFTHGVFRVELRLLRQITHFNARLRARFPFDIFINTGHDAQQGRFTRAVQTEYADFGAREEAERDILQNVTLRRYHFADAMHAIDELSHVMMSLLVCK